MREELINRVHLAPVRVLALLGMGQAARHEQVPELLQAALFASQRFLGRPRLFDGKRDVRPVEHGKAQPRFLAVRHGQAPQRAAVKRPFERDDEPAVAVLGGLHPAEEH